MENDLPKGWRELPLLDAASLTTGRKDVNEGNEDGEYLFFTCAAVPLRSRKFSFQGEAILLPGNGANVGHLFYYEGRFEAYQRTYVLQNFKTNPRYLYYHLKWNWSEVVKEKQFGTATNFIKQENFKSYHVRIAPPLEQDRIVAKLDALMEKIERSKTRLEKIPIILKRFRQSVLAAAVSGKLTEEWRSLHGNIPWQVKTIDEIADVSGGVTLNAKRKTLNIQMPYLRVGNVYANRLDLSEVKKVGVEEREITRATLKRGDLLVVEGNGSIDQIGRVAMWNDEIKGCLHQNHLIKLRCSDIVTAKFILFFLLSIQGREQIEEASKSTSGLHTLSLSKVSSITVLFPPISEQAEIVNIVEGFLLVVDKIDRKYCQANKHFDTISQSILSKAFRGELVSQEINHEPAEILKIGAQEGSTYYKKLKSF